MGDPRSDDELMVLGAEGDEAAFRLLVMRWEKPVFAFLEIMVGSREEAQDIAQETFLRMCRSAGRYQPCGRFRSWLFRIAGNEARNRLRRRKVLAWVSFNPEFHDRPAAEERADSALERTEEQTAVRRALLRLPERQRQAIHLRQFEGLAYKEIAEAMGTSVSAVETLLFRAMTALLEELTREDRT